MRTQTESNRVTERIKYADGTERFNVIQDDVYRVRVYAGLIRIHDVFQMGERIAPWPSPTLPGAILLIIIILLFFVGRG